MRLSSRHFDIPHRAMALAATLVLSAAGCSDNATGPQQAQTGDLHFVKLSASAPPLVAASGTFWAKKGEDREIRLYFRPRTGESDSTEFLRFEVKSQSLLRRPDGSAIAQGDSVLITVTVADLANLIVDFQPSGLRFDPNEPARLKLDWNEASDDLDDDGDVDQDDVTLEGELAIWRRETAAEPWVKLASQVEVSLHQVEASVLGFTNYAIAYRR